MKMMREGRSRDSQAGLKTADRNACFPYLYQRSVNPQARGVPQSLELSCCINEFHDRKLFTDTLVVNRYF